jgi:hypothetical protein
MIEDKARFSTGTCVAADRSMIQRIGACILVSSLAVGCGVGDDELEPLDPNPNKLVCTDAFKVTGTFTADPAWPRPATDPGGEPFTGCWPVGTWNFTVSLDPADDNIQDITGDQQGDRCGRVTGTQPATFDAAYSFTVLRMQDPNGEDTVDDYRLNGSVQEGGKTKWNDKWLYKVKVTEGGGGECEGGLELYSLDGKSYWNLHPMLEGTALTGFGDFHVYQEVQY